MIEKKVANHYAKVLHIEAQKSKLTDAVLDDMDFLQKGFCDSSKLLQYTRYKYITVSHWMDILSSKKSFVSSFQEVTIKLLKLMAYNKRMDLLFLLPVSYKSIYDECKGYLRASLFSAIPFKDKQLELLKKKIATAYSVKEVILEQQIDKSLISGFKIKIGDMDVEHNIQSQLNKIKYNLVI